MNLFFYISILLMSVLDIFCYLSTKHFTFLFKCKFFMWYLFYFSCISMNKIFFIVLTITLHETTSYFLSLLKLHDNKNQHSLIFPSYPICTYTYIQINCFIIDQATTWRLNGYGLHDFQSVPHIKLSSSENLEGNNFDCFSKMFMVLSNYFEAWQHRSPFTFIVR